MRAYGKAALVAAVLVGLSGCSDTESGPTSAEPSVMATPAAIAGPLDGLPERGDFVMGKPPWWSGPAYSKSDPHPYSTYAAQLWKPAEHPAWGRGTTRQHELALRLWALAFPIRVYDIQNTNRDWELVCTVLETESMVPERLLYGGDADYEVSATEFFAFNEAVRYTCPNLAHRLEDV